MCGSMVCAQNDCHAVPRERLRAGSRMCHRRTAWFAMSWSNSLYCSIRRSFRWSACGILVRLTRRCSIGTSSSQGNGRPHHCWKPWDKIRLYGIVAQSRIDDQPVVLSKPSEFSTTKTDAWQKTFVSGACVLEPKFLHFYV